MVYRRYIQILQTGKCEEFKGEGYWCKIDYLSKNMYQSEDDRRMFCLLEMKEANGTITKVSFYVC